MDSSTKFRLAQLDFLRALAVFMVIGNHASICPPELNGFLNKITTIWYRGGWSGVDLFFVLSGFLISGLLFNEYKKNGDISIKRFLIRRGFKLYPAFWFLLFVTVIVLSLSGEPIYKGGFIAELLFVQNYHDTIWEHTWSLAVEEHFYILLSFVFFVLLAIGKRAGRNPFASVPLMFAVVAVVCLSLRLITSYYLPYSYGQNIEPTHLRIDSLFGGVFVSYLWNFRGLPGSLFLQKYKLLIGIAGILCFVPAFVFELRETAWLSTFGLNLLYLGGGFLLVSLLVSDLQNPIFRQFARLGKYSYSIYLWNLPTHVWLTKFTNLAVENWYLYAVIYWSATLVLGIGTAKIIEYPILNLRDKFMPSQISAIKPA